MKFSQNLAITGITLVFLSCGNNLNRLNIHNSKSFSEKQITLDGAVFRNLPADSLSVEMEIAVQDTDVLLRELSEMITMADRIRKNQSDSTWIELTTRWKNFRTNHTGPVGWPRIQTATPSDSGTDISGKASTGKWAELNVKLLKFSGEVRFGDALEKILYESKIPALSEKLLKSAIYTRIDDQIFVNLIASSSMNYQHTTGGTVRLIQKTDYPAGYEMTLTCECADIRYLDVYIRIPAWAVNPTVTHGNVKYVPHPGEYCLISRKWKDGDEIKVVLKN